MTPFTAELVVEGYLNGVRIDSFLEKHFRNYTPWRLQRMVRAGMVKVNDESIRLAFRVYRGQRVAVTLSEPPDKLLSPFPRPLDVVFEDPWLLVVNKPPGLVAHPCGDFQTGTLANVVQAHLDRSTPFPGLLRPGIVHRLDRLTSGIIVVPKEHLSHRLLSIQFQNERISKEYVAIVDGVVPNDTGLIDLPIGRIPGGKSILVSCRGDAIDRQPSRTRYEVLQRFDDHTFVRAKPATGRFHQIRVHFATIGFPVTADEFYEPFGTVRPPRTQGSGVLATVAETLEDDDENAEIDDWTADAAETEDSESSPLMRRHALHALSIRFTHPITQEWMEFTAPLPGDMRRAVRLLADRSGQKPVTTFGRE